MQNLTELPPVNIIWHETETDFYYEKQFGPYYVSSKLGQGAFGVVKAGEDLQNKRPVAIKLINKTGLNELDQQSIKTEAEVMSYLHHINVVALYSVFESSRQICMVMEYAGGGDLLEHILRQTKVSEVEARKLFVQLLDGLSYTHSMQIVHRDIKAQNIFLDEKLETVKIGDWGFATLYIPGVSLGNPCGTLHYAAPEILTQDPYLGPEIDVWALGAVLYFMVSGLLPFRGSTDFEVFSKIKKGEYRSLPGSLSDDLKDIVSQIFNIDRKTRPTLAQLTNHKWCARAQLDPEYLKRPKLPRLLQLQIRNYRSSKNLSPRNSGNYEPISDTSEGSLSSGSSLSSAASSQASSTSGSGLKLGSSPMVMASPPVSATALVSPKSPSAVSSSNNSSSKKRSHQDKSSRRRNNGEKHEKREGSSSDKSHRKGKRKKGDQGKARRRDRQQIEEEEEVEDHTEAEDLTNGCIDFDELIPTPPPISAKTITPPPEIPPPVVQPPPPITVTVVEKPIIPLPNVPKHIPIPIGGLKREQLSPDMESIPTSIIDISQEPALRSGRRASSEGAPIGFYSDSPVQIRQQQQQQETAAPVPRPKPKPIRRKPTVRSSFRKSTYTMLRVDNEGLQKIKTDKDVELLSVETNETGEHVVFVSAKSGLGQETQALEKLKGFELGGTRKNRSQSIAVKPNRRSIFLTDVTKIFTEGAIEEGSETEPPGTDSATSRQRRAYTYNIKQPENSLTTETIPSATTTKPVGATRTTTQPINPPSTTPTPPLSIPSNPVNTNNTSSHLSQTAPIKSPKSPKSPPESTTRATASSAKWKSASHLKHSPVAEEEPPNHKDNNSHSNHNNNDPSDNTIILPDLNSPKSASSWTHSRHNHHSKSGSHGKHNNPEKTRKHKKVVVTPMGSRRATVDSLTTPEDV